MSNDPATYLQRFGVDGVVAAPERSELEQRLSMMDPARTAHVEVNQDNQRRAMLVAPVWAVVIAVNAVKAANAAWHANAAANANAVANANANWNVNWNWAVPRQSLPSNIDRRGVLHGQERFG